MISKKPTSISRRNFLSNSAVAATGFMIVPRFVLGGISPNGTRYLPPSDMINLGMIGTGKQAKGLANAFIGTGETRIVAASEVYQAKAQLLLERVKAYYEKNTQFGTYSDIALHTDFREMLTRKDIDAVVIATPDHWHAVQAVKSAEAGKDIYCEKPLALTVK
jgi:predicted dehydrogenase